MLIRVTLQSVGKVKKRLKRRIHWFEDDKKMQFAFIDKAEGEKLKGVKGVSNALKSGSILTESRMGR